MKKMCRSGCHHNSFVATHVIEHMIAYIIYDIFIYLYIFIL